MSGPITFGEAADILEWHARTGGLRRTRERLRTPDLARAEAIADALDDVGSVVYFVKVGRLVKIGTTTNLRERLRRLHLPLTAILAVYPGDCSAEHDEHVRWRHLRAHVPHSREHFHPGDDLMDYIGGLRAHAGV